jgi:hypothetical protein
VVMLLFFLEALAKTLLLLKVSMLSCMAMTVALPYWTALEGLALGVSTWASF